MPSNKKNPIIKASNSLTKKTFNTKRSKVELIPEPVPVGWKAVSRKFLNRPKRSLSLMGFFQFLPIEIRFKILRSLSAEGMAKFACASKSSNELVLEFLKSPQYLILMTKSCFKSHYSSGVSAKKCRDLGTVLRAITSPYPFNEAMQIIREYCHVMRDEMNAIAQSVEDFDGSKRQRVIGLVLKSILELHFNDKQLLLKAVQAVQAEATKEGYNLSMASIELVTPVERMKIRNLYHKLFLEPQECWCDRVPILTAILDTFATMKEKAAMIVLLFGPLNNYIPVWHLLPQISLISQELMSSMLTHLAECLMNLHRFGDISVAQYMELLDEICLYPSPWRQENKVLLIMLSGYGVTVMYLHQSTNAVIQNFQFQNDQKMVAQLLVSEASLDKLAKLTIRFLSEQHRFPQLINESSLQTILHLMLKMLAEKRLHLTFLDCLWNKLIIRGRTAFIQNFHGNHDNIKLLFRIMQSVRHLQTGFLKLNL